MFNREIVLGETTFRADGCAMKLERVLKDFHTLSFDGDTVTATSAPVPVSFPPAPLPEDVRVFLVHPLNSAERRVEHDRSPALYRHWGINE